jgi:hypothetical protein
MNRTCNASRSFFSRAKLANGEKRIASATTARTNTTHCCCCCAIFLIAAGLLPLVARPNNCPN